MEPFRIGYFWQCSYAVALATHLLIIFCLIRHSRAIIQFVSGKFFVLTSDLCVLMLTFEWIAGMLYVEMFRIARNRITNCANGDIERRPLSHVAKHLFNPLPAL